MVQLFQNLLSNAIKYRNNTRPIIWVTAEKQPSYWLFSVSDNGIGIDAQYTEKVFKVFQRLHSDRKKYPGTGIGLALCKKIVDRHRGRLWFESEAGKGTTFHFTLRSDV